MANGNLVAAGVDADMARIFGKPNPRLSPVIRSEAQAPRARRRTGRWMFVVLSLAALAAVGMTAIRPELKRTDVPSRSIVSPIAVASAVPAYSPRTILAEQDVPAKPAAFNRVANARPSPSPVVAASSSRSKANRPELVLELDASRAMPAAAFVKSRQALLPVEPAVCEVGSSEDRCIYRDVIDADRRLRIAYRRAEHDGVANGELRQVRQQWDRALSVSLDAPDETIRRYNQLAQRLDFAPSRSE